MNSPLPKPVAGGLVLLATALACAVGNPEPQARSTLCVSAEAAAFDPELPDLLAEVAEPLVGYTVLPAGSHCMHQVVLDHRPGNQWLATGAVDALISAPRWHMAPYETRQLSLTVALDDALWEPAD